MDLGCGPGHTTRLLHEVTEAMRTVGLDASAAYVERARSRGSADVTFEVHDATALPLPVEPAHAIYARLLLAHLRDPADVVAGWVSQLSEGGVVLLVGRVDRLPEAEELDPERPTVVLLDEELASRSGGPGVLGALAPYVAFIGIGASGETEPSDLLQAVALTSWLPVTASRGQGNDG